MCLTNAKKNKNKDITLNCPLHFRVIRISSRFFVIVVAVVVKKAYRAMGLFLKWMTEGNSEQEKYFENYNFESPFYITSYN